MYEEESPTSASMIASDLLARQAALMGKRKSLMLERLDKEAALDSLLETLSGLKSRSQDVKKGELSKEVDELKEELSILVERIRAIGEQVDDLERIYNSENPNGGSKGKEL
jgi:hypothetical protein